MEKIIFTDCVRNEEVLQRAEKDRNIPHKIERRKANWIGYILRKNCLLKRVIKGNIEGRIQVMGTRGRKRKQLLDDFMATTRY
jgi:hypothetical protein